MWICAPLGDNGKADGGGKVVPSGMLHQIGSPNPPKQKSISELVREMAEREAREIAELRAQALKPRRTP